MAVVFVGWAFTVLFAFLALHRLRYPYELSWLESYMYAPVQRLLLGQSIY